MTAGAICVFHRTWAEYGDDILTNGFKDGVEGFVQLADVPLESVAIKGGGGVDVSVGIVLPEDVLAQYEDKTTHYRGQGVRVFNVPAAVLNRYPVHLHETNYIGMTEGPDRAVAELCESHPEPPAESSLRAVEGAGKGVGLP